jgi:hypothetical protein
MFTIVETNSFKHINHLSLQFLPGNDASLKKYLASLVLAFKEQNHQLQSKLSQVEGQLKKDVEQLSAENQHLKQTVESLRFDAADRENRLKLEHAETSSRERERWTREKENVLRDVESTKSALISRYEQQLSHTTGQVIYSRLHELPHLLLSYPTCRRSTPRFWPTSDIQKNSCMPHGKRWIW